MLAAMRRSGGRLVARCGAVPASVPAAPGSAGVGAAASRASRAWPEARTLISGLQQRPVDAASWGLRVSLENTYLSWTRNSIIATVAGCALIQYKVDHAKLNYMPLSGLGFLFLGFTFMTLGQVSYIHASWVLRNLLGFSTLDWLWIGLNAVAPQAIWTTSIYSFLNGAPKLLSPALEKLRRRQGVFHALRDPAPSSSRHYGHFGHHEVNTALS